MNSIFSNSFCKVTLNNCLENIKNSRSFNMVGLPGVGISYFLKHLMTSTVAKFFYINSYELENFSKEDLFELIYEKTMVNESNNIRESILTKIKTNLEVHTQKNERVVLVFNRFDRLLPVFNQSLFDNLRALHDVNRQKIVFIFVTSRPISELKPEAIKDQISMFADLVYFQPYSKADLLEITQVDGTPEVKGKALILSGGHHALFHTLLNCQNLEKPLSDPMVELLIKNLVTNLHAREQETLKNIALNLKTKPDEYLRKVGLVTEDNEPLTPLISKFLLQHTKQTLPHNEKKLFSLLKLNLGRVVKKEAIFDHIWKEEVASDWALNSLVYRLRRHPAFDSNRYSIKSVKKDGYILIDSYK